MNRFVVLACAAAIGSMGCSRTPEPTKQDTSVTQNVDDASESNQSSQGGLKQAELGDRTAELDDVFEAVFRHKFEHNASGVQQAAKAFFLSITNKDPSPQFLERFAGNLPPVRNGSEFMMGDGVVFHIEGWKWKSETEVEITCGYYEHPLSASHNRYTLVRDEGRWTVEGDVMESIS